MKTLEKLKRKRTVSIALLCTLLITTSFYVLARPQERFDFLEMDSKLTENGMVYVVKDGSGNVLFESANFSSVLQWAIEHNAKDGQLIFSKPVEYGLGSPYETEKTSSYIVGQVGSYTYMLNGTTGRMDWYSTNDDAVIQATIDNVTGVGGSVFVKQATYSASVTLKDNVTLRLETGASGVSVSIDAGATAWLLDYENNAIKYWNGGVLSYHLEDGKLYTNLNMTQHELEDALFHKGTSFPSSPIEGQYFWRTDLDLLYVYTGSNWEHQGNSPERTNGTFTLQSNTNEQTLLEITPTTITNLYNVYIDLTALTKNCTVKVYSKIDGTNYVEMPSMTLDTITSSNRKGLLLKEMMIDTDFKITIQSEEAEGATRSIPYRYFKEEY